MDKYKTVKKRSWLKYFYNKFGKNPRCENCAKKLIYFSSKKENLVRFFSPRKIHKHGPLNWITHHKFDKQNKKIWEAYNYHIFCSKCLFFVPVKGKFFSWYNKKEKSPRAGWSYFELAARIKTHPTLLKNYLPRIQKILKEKKLPLIKIKLIKETRIRITKRGNTLYRCTKCGRWKKGRDFHRRGNGILRPSCIECDRVAFREEWKRYFKSKYDGRPRCEICSKYLRYFGSANELNEIVCFDHGSKAGIDGRPHAWLRSNFPTERNIKIWEANKFGLLCRRDNLHLLRMNRRKTIEYLKRHL